MRNLILIILILPILLLCQEDSLSYRFKDGMIEGIDSLSQLDSLATFRFIIFSDNKGDSPTSSESFARMIDWTRESYCFIGLGDHVKKGWGNSFWDFIQTNQEWTDRFYPNIADGENEYYGKSQGDWGAGGEFLSEIGMEKRTNTQIRDNGCEYYSKISCPSDFMIHLIQLHYPDNPPNDSIAFKPDSRKFLIETLESIQRNEKDIIIAAAHSYDGFWFDELSESEQDIIMQKCDLVLSATSHFFEIFDVIPDSIAPVFINTGSIPHSVAYCPPGYLDVHVLDNPPAIIGQYINANIPIREFQNSDYSFLKIPGGATRKTEFRKKRETENYDKIIGSINSSLTKAEMTAIAESLYIAKTNSDMAIIDSTEGIQGPEVSNRQLWKVFPYNNEIWVLNLPPEDFILLFGDRYDIDGNSTIRVAVNSYLGSYLVDKRGLSEDKVEKTGIYEIGLLTEWLSSKIDGLSE
ncbi:MAG: hypothetical protein ACLFSQ_00610 [Candidatus Zixiibacteriota bacterium]